ncbi:hypothetical protein FB45DRAFT_877688 [Roridomyces roridus]|uniref:Uncharacterized protein n=1 Tax=Roridomyces roridus TaxID=1738132 RepID=A0AAD7B1J0_9AGAR|nr:hypothetical protein FB45DRAFT_877688 [Roridomyces roridus]
MSLPAEAIKNPPLYGKGPKATVRSARGRWASIKQAIKSPGLSSEFHPDTTSSCNAARFTAASASLRRPRGLCGARVILDPHALQNQGSQPRAARTNEGCEFLERIEGVSRAPTRPLTAMAVALTAVMGGRTGLTRPSNHAARPQNGRVVPVRPVTAVMTVNIMDWYSGSVRKRSSGPSGRLPMTQVHYRGASSDDGGSACVISRVPVATRHDPSTAGNGYPVDTQRHAH